VGAGLEPFRQPGGRFGDRIGPRDAAGVEAEFGGAVAQPFKEAGVQKSRSA
jgi:hypothetical protein